MILLHKTGVWQIGFVETGSCSNEGVCQHEDIMQQLDGGDALLLNGFRDFAFQAGGVVHERLNNFFPAELQYFMAGKV